MTPADDLTPVAVDGLDVSGLRPVARLSTSEVVASQLRAGMLDGTFPPGTQMREARLAKQLNISRGPLREAMHRLIQEGLLLNRPYRGVFVVRLSREDVNDIYFVREAIEIPAALHLALDPSPSLIAPIAEMVEMMGRAAKAHDWAQVVELDARFHELVVTAAGSVRLARMFQTIQAETRMCLGALKPAYPSEYDVVIEHRDLLARVLSGSKDDITRAWTVHLRDAAANLAQFYPSSDSAEPEAI